MKTLVPDNRFPLTSKVKLELDAGYIYCPYVPIFRSNGRQWYKRLFSFVYNCIKFILTCFMPWTWKQKYRDYKHRKNIISRYGVDKLNTSHLWHSVTVQKQI